MTAALDLGSGHRLTWYTRDGAAGHVGAVVYHPRKPGDLTCAWRGEECAGSILFDVPGNPEQEGRPRWNVGRWEPLTLAPSLLCHCGDHGFIIDGRWVPA